MLYTSREFLLAFLPLTLVITGLLFSVAGRRSGIAALTVASVVFYGWWELNALAIIFVSIGFNYLVASAIADAESDRNQKRLLAVGVTANLAALAYFKYANFLVGNVEALLGKPLGHIEVALPLAISFYTFQQVAFLVDTYRKEMGRAPLQSYIISVLFFPHLIAGPLLHYRNIITQFDRFRITVATIAVGAPVFAVGLAKKVAIADPLAVHVSPLFEKSAQAPLEFFEAWAAALGYTAQLYFDFSGYSDMAIGLALMFGIALPLNFYSPYKATSIVEFWRRWHITLSSFLRDYLYIPLGGGRKGPERRYINLFIVMLLGGLWHGAAWTFVAWGAIHGVLLVLNHAWRQFKPARLVNADQILSPVYGAATFLFVVVAWVFFRATSFPSALNVISGMFAPAVISLPGELSYFIGTGWPTTVWGGGMSYLDFVSFWFFALLGYSIIWAAPNTAEIFGLDGENLPNRVPLGSSFRYQGIGVAASVAVLAWISSFGVFGAEPSEFLYFQF